MTNSVDFAAFKYTSPTSSAFYILSLGMKILSVLEAWLCVYFYFNSFFGEKLQHFACLRGWFNLKMPKALLLDKINICHVFS